MENVSEIINTILIPIVQIAIPVGLVLAITERIINTIFSFIRGDRNVKI